MKKYLITICARSGSLGVPDKNIKLLNGIPLLAYSIRLANILKNFINADIAFSTDSERYKNIAKEYGLYTDYLRPKHLASHTAGKIDVITDLVKYSEEKNKVNYDYVLELEVTSPLRNTNDILSAINIMESNKKALVVFGVTLSTKNPYYNLVEKKSDGFYKLCIEDKNSFVTRQSAPKAYESNGMLYLFRRNFFDSGYKMIFTESTLIYESPHICFDIDTVTDFEFMDYLISNNKLDFKLDK